MHFMTVIALFTSLAAAAPFDPRDTNLPSAHEVTIDNITFAGSGCPAGSVASQFSDDRTTLTLLYGQMIAQAGKGVPPAAYRKNCQLNFKLHFPQGWQFSIFTVDYRGYAKLPKKDTGTVKATYYFSGQAQQITSKMTIDGPFDDNYLKEDRFGVKSTVWSPCGAEGLLNINSEVSIAAEDENKIALLTVSVANEDRWAGCWLTTSSRRTPRICASTRFTISSGRSARSKLFKHLDQAGFPPNPTTTQLGSSSSKRQWAISVK
jgi:hypothetical protein